jgi:hypothetical protein
MSKRTRVSVVPQVDQPVSTLLNPFCTNCKQVVHALSLRANDHHHCDCGAAHVVIGDELVRVAMPLGFPLLRGKR